MIVFSTKNLYAIGANFLYEQVCEKFPLQKL